MAVMKNGKFYNSFMWSLYSQLRYSAGEFQAVQLIVLAVFGAVD